MTLKETKARIVHSALTKDQAIKALVADDLVGVVEFKAAMYDRLDGFRAESAEAIKIAQKMEGVR